MKIPVSYSNLTDFGSEDKKYLKMLESDENFELLIKKAREKCGCNKGATQFNTPELYETATREAQNIATIYDLPESWQMSLAWFIVNNQFNPPGIGIYFSGESQQIVEKGIREDKLRIIVTQKMSYDSLCKWIYHNKKVIMDRLKRLPKRKIPPRIFFELRCKIYELYQKGLKPVDIEKELNRNKYKDLRGLSSATSPNISKWIYQFKRTLKGYPLNRD